MRARSNAGVHIGHTFRSGIEMFSAAKIPYFTVDKRFGSTRQWHLTATRSAEAAVLAVIVVGNRYTKRFFLPASKRTSRAVGFSFGVSPTY